MASSLRLDNFKCVNYYTVHHGGITETDAFDQ